MINSRILLDNRLDIKKIIPFYAGLTAFFLPISTSLKGIFSSLLIISVLLVKDYRTQIVAVLQTPWCRALLLFVGFVCIANMWGEASFTLRKIITFKSLNLLYMPFLYVAFTDKRARDYAIHAFLLAMVVTVVVSFLKEYNFIDFHQETVGEIFHNHIITGFYISFAALISISYFLRFANKYRYLYLVAFLLFSYQNWFLNVGRTGYVVYLVLAALFLIQHFSWQKVIVSAVLGVVAIVGIYATVPSFNTAINSAIADVENYSGKDKNTSVGWRLQFHDFAKELFLRSPVLGQGTGGFGHAFRQENPVPGWPNSLIEPHGQYWFVAAEFGLIGLFLFSFFFYNLIKAALSLTFMRRNLALSLITAFLVCCISDSFLFYSATNYLLIMFLAIFFGCKQPGPEA